MSNNSPLAALCGMALLAAVAPARLQAAATIKFGVDAKSPTKLPSLASISNKFLTTIAAAFLLTTFFRPRNSPIYD